MIDKTLTPAGRQRSALPAIGDQYDPDGFNLANRAIGIAVRRWTHEIGQSQTRYHNGAGSRNNDLGEAWVRDCMAPSQGVIASQWEVDTALAHYRPDVSRAAFLSSISR